MDNKPIVPARDDPEFGSKVKKIRMDLNLTRDEFALKLGMGTSTLYAWEELGNRPNSPDEQKLPPMPPSNRLYKRLVAFVETGQTFEDQKMGNASTGPKKNLRTPDPAGPQAKFSAEYGLDLKHITEADLVRELMRRGFKVTLSM